MVNCLMKEQVPVIFGYPGATIAPFYDALASSGIRHILTRTEQGAGHAASGYARITGRPGVCVATSGPGATNMFTAIATAYSDSIPLVAITGQVATYQLGRDVFQEVDTTGAAEPFTKYSYLVKSADDLARVFKEAFYIASTGRKGPVLIDVPVDVQKQLADFNYPDRTSIRGYKPTYDGHPLQIKKAADAIRRAKKPLICCGGGLLSSGSEVLVRRFCEAAKLPCVSTMMGIGAISPNHPLYFGMLGQSGVHTANTAVGESDLLILLGARVGDRAFTRPSSLESEATIIHIDIDTAEIGKNMGTTIPIVGDLYRVLEQLEQKNLQGTWDEWLGYLGALREEDKGSRPVNAQTVDPNALVRLLCRYLPENSVYVADVGQNQIWSARNYSIDGRFLTTGGMGTMGYSIPAAIGAKLASKDKTVAAVCGDGAFQMSMNELATMRQHDAPVKIVVMRNGKLGMVREIQQSSYGGREIAVDLTGSPDLSLIAQAYGIPYALVNDMDNAEKIIGGMLNADGACLIECLIDPKEGTIWKT